MCKYNYLTRTMSNPCTSKPVDILFRVPPNFLDNFSITKQDEDLKK